MTEVPRCTCGAVTDKGVFDAGQTYIDLIENLLACYRVGRRPSAKVLDGIGPAREKWEAIEKEIV